MPPVPYKDSARLKEYQRNWYIANGNQVRSRTKNARVVLRDEVNQIKENRGCEECHKPFPYYVLDFDHRMGTKKVANVRVLIRTSTREAVFAEIAKCDVVCANCHRERTYRRSLRG